MTEGRSLKTEMETERKGMQNDVTGRISSFRDLRVYQLAFELQQELFEISKLFPLEERYALTDRLRRSSRSVGANLAEACSAP